MSKYLINGNVVFDSRSMTLSRGDIMTELTANEAELLFILMQGAASKQAVIEQIWESKGLFVTEGSYYQLVRALRVKLDEQGVTSTYVKTLPRFGLRFVGIVEELDDVSPAPISQEQVETAESELIVVETETCAAPPAPAERAAVATSASGHDVAVSAPTIAQSVGRVVDASLCRRTAFVAIYIALAVWTGVLTWQTLRHRDTTFTFRFQKTIDGIHYFSNGRMQQLALLKAIEVTPYKGGYVYEIELGSNDWLAVCSKSIYEFPELCDTYFIEKSG
ncbi:helix-turn-helix domain-containing protein [Burkholderia pyrrocinia]|uniref:winged helix-turn-helix domain-containing protein n=1 Tax=Burkholderia pyrrocinia TaxID=60550 RepID=UPI00157512FB|nr:helix-turn-helix domain-containing protein [Burkholderia pyrrocinia]NTX25626.1 helix-turn-helix domain-containing protein [Burkholderia pyrrocinia]